MSDVRKKSIALSVLAFSLVAATILTFAQSKKPQVVPSSGTEDLSTVDFCELAKHPKGYVNKVVRSEMNYIGWWESSYLYGEACNEDKYKIHNALDCPGDGMCLDCTPGDDTCKKRYEEVWTALAPYLRSDKEGFASRVRAVVVGRLIGPGHYGHLGGFRYEFRIRKVEKGRAIPDSVPW